MVDEPNTTAETETPQAAAAAAQSAKETGGEKSAAGKPSEGKSLDAIFGVKLDVRVVLGRSRLPISELLDLTKGSVIELDRRIGEPVDIMINDRMVARGDLVRVQGDMLGVRDLRYPP
jgi:flagellar motor switch protein FliN/FliY